jgi:hypothetical protein
VEEVSLIFHSDDQYCNIERSTPLLFLPHASSSSATWWSSQLLGTDRFLSFIFFFQIPISIHFLRVPALSFTLPFGDFHVLVNYSKDEKLFLLKDWMGLF